jgi:hypothetical protein
MRLLVVVIFCVVVGPSMGARTMFAEKIKCSADEATKLEDESNKIRGWVLLHKFYLRYRACAPDDAVVTQGVSRSVARLLVDQWNTLPTGAGLMDKDAGFRKFVLDGINATVADDDLKTIKQRSQDACPAGGQGVCVEIEKAADDSLKAGTSTE